MEAVDCISMCLSLQPTRFPLGLQPTRFPCRFPLGLQPTRFPLGIFEAPRWQLRVVLNIIGATK